MRRQPKDVNLKAATRVHVLDVKVIRNLRVVEFFVGLFFESVEERFVHSTAQEQRPSTSYECLSRIPSDKQAAKREGTTYPDVIPHRGTRAIHLGGTRPV